MCFRRFYADKLENHNTYCQLKREKALNQKDLNGKFNFLSNEATQLKVKLDKYLNQIYLDMMPSDMKASHKKVTPRIKQTNNSLFALMDNSSLKNSKQNLFQQNEGSNPIQKNAKNDSSVASSQHKYA